MARTLAHTGRKAPGLPWFATVANTTCNVWQERDRLQVELYDLGNPAHDQLPIFEAWDDEARELVEDGFLDPNDWHGSAVWYLNHLNGY